MLEKAVEEPEELSDEAALDPSDMAWEEGEEEEPLETD